MWTVIRICNRRKMTIVACWTLVYDNVTFPGIIFGEEGDENELNFIWGPQYYDYGSFCWNTRNIYNNDLHCTKKKCMKKWPKTCLWYMFSWITEYVNSPLQEKITCICPSQQVLWSRGPGNRGHGMVCPQSLPGGGKFQELTPWIPAPANTLCFVLTVCLPQCRRLCFCFQ
jgi:hypothetical protein